MKNNFLGLTNSTQESKDLVYRNGITGLKLYGHSRGSMTVGNALQSLDKQGLHGLADQTEINLYAPSL
ncbi:hypothetical protein [Bartonella sp. B39]